MYLESIGFELKRNNNKAAELILNKGLQIYPSDGRLWSLAIIMGDNKTRKSKTAEALQRSAENLYVLLSVARLFQS